MKSFKVAHETTRDLYLNSVYDLYSSVVMIKRDKDSTCKKRSTNASCQCKIRKNPICTCRQLATLEQYRYSPKQVYTYTDGRSYTEIGIGSIKVLPRKKTRKIYLLESIDRAIGSEDLTTYINGRSNQGRTRNSYNKRTSSKCVGGFVDNENVSLVNKNLTPMIENKSETTRHKSDVLNDHEINVMRNESHKYESPISTQENEFNAKTEFRAESENNKQSFKHILKVEVTRDMLPKNANKLKPSIIDNNIEICKDYSSVSFVQHIHNLENPSDYKRSKMSVNPVEKSSEREFSKEFTSNKVKQSTDKSILDLKSVSLLRRRFEALRRGLGKKVSKKDSILNEKISETEMPSHDVSIIDDEASLEGRFCSSTKVYSPNECKLQEKVTFEKSPKGKQIKNCPQLLIESGDSKYESIKDIFKLCGKKLNLDEDYKTSPKILNHVKNSVEKLSKSESPPQTRVPKKKHGKKFFLFGKKTKEKGNKSCKVKKGLTAGRCEVKGGLKIKVGANECAIDEPVMTQENHLEKYDDIQRKAWLDKYISNKRDSRNSVHIRWNNKMYGTSSSTVLELMDGVYKRTAINLRSRSEITVGDSSNYHSYTKQRVHFMQRYIEAWMIPKLKTNKYQRSINYRAFHGQNKCQRWYLDTSKGFPQKIELVLLSKPSSVSSEYVYINIPETYLSRPSIDIRVQSSDEKIYKIVEYDDPELKKIKESRRMATGDNFNRSKVNDCAENVNKRKDKHKIEELGERNIQDPSLRDIAIQGSDVFVPKRCDVIGVGIVTQRDIRDVQNPILKLEDELSDDEQDQTNSVCEKKCELAESYLQDYCRNLMPSGIDMFSWEISEFHSENNSIGSLSQGDGTKSYPSVYDNFQESTIVLSSCETSSCSHCIGIEDERRLDDSLKCKFLNKFKKKSPELLLNATKRNFPKDSIEVHKKRQYYACNNQRSVWFEECDESSSLENSSTQCNIVDCKAKSLENQKLNKPCWKIPKEKECTKKQRKEKRVSLPNCEAMSKLVDKLSDKVLEGILSFKGSSCNKKGLSSPKCTEVLPEPTCIIPQPPCKETCENDKKPPCAKKDSLPCDDFPSPHLNHKISIPPREMKPSSPCHTPPRCKKPKSKPPCSACSPDASCDNLQQNYPDSDIPPERSGLNISISPGVSHESSNVYFPCSSNTKECKPNCANKIRLLNKLANTPTSPLPTAYHLQQPPESKDKTGLHLKKMPNKKKVIADNCYDSDCTGIILLNSQERFTIRMRKDSPSAEEIRKSLNIKVQDEDGQTLYERKDYKQSGDINKCQILQDVYKDSRIQRVSTPTAVQDVTDNKSQNEVLEIESDSSVDNLIEINFSLKLKQGEKGTEVNIKNIGDAEIKEKIEGKVIESQKNIFIVKNEQEPVLNGNKKDVNIKIVVKNYNADQGKNNETDMCAVRNTGDDGFNKRISERFQTVSTGYSDVDPHAFSVHRTTVDLTTSYDKYRIQNKRSECTISNDLVNVPKRLKISMSLAEHTNDQTVNSIKYNREEISMESVKHFNAKNFDSTIFGDELNTFNNNKPKKCSRIESEHRTNTDKTSEASIMYQETLFKQKQKNDTPEKILGSSNGIKKPESEKNIKEIMQTILTSNSSETEKDVGIELATELAYASMEKKYIRNTDSMNNFYQVDRDEDKLPKFNRIENNTELNDTEISIDNKNQRCMCSVLANKLNKLNVGSKKYNNSCRCRRHVKKDEEVNCNVTDHDAEDITQSSKYFLDKLNSVDMSNGNPMLITNTSVIKETVNESSQRKSSKTHRTDKNDTEYYKMKRLDKETILGLTNDDIVVLNSNVVKKSVSKRKKITRHLDKRDAAHILQLNETKKAVLEIYKERVVSDTGEHIVARLPKFHVNKNDIRNYGNIAGCKKVSKRNIVAMTVDL